MITADEQATLNRDYPAGKVDRAAAEMFLGIRRPAARRLSIRDRWQLLILALREYVGLA